MDCYTEDFEKFLLSETAAFYKKKAAAWIVVRPRACPPLPACQPHTHTQSSFETQGCMHEKPCLGLAKP